MQHALADMLAVILEHNVRTKMPRCGMGGKLWPVEALHALAAPRMFHV